MGSVWNISNSPHLSSELFRHLRYYIAFNFPNSNTYELTPKYRNVLEMCASFLEEVLNQSKNDELFLRHFGFIENIFI